MNNFRSLTRRLITAMEIPDIEIPVSGVKFVKKDDSVPDGILQLQPDNFSITSCHALKASMLDDAVYLGKESVGCVAAAISLGLVEKKAQKPLIRFNRKAVSFIMRSIFLLIVLAQGFSQNLKATEWALVCHTPCMN